RHVSPNLLRCASHVPAHPGRFDAIRTREEDGRLSIVDLPGREKQSPTRARATTSSAGFFGISDGTTKAAMIPADTSWRLPFVIRSPQSGKADTTGPVHCQRMYQSRTNSGTLLRANNVFPLHVFATDKSAGAWYYSPCIQPGGPFMSLGKDDYRVKYRPRRYDQFWQGLDDPTIRTLVEQERAVK